MPNHLADQSSPYLLQHKDNPVDWYPWDDEALAKAKQEDKPIFLSIGYSACHWCHVMEHESFENDEIAALLNESFVCVKVDREERPDLDQIYMQAVQMMTGRGGWPMSVFLTPELKPFYGGTYWPPRESRGMPGFDRVIQAVDDAWQNKRQQLEEQAGEMTQHLQQGLAAAEDGDGLQIELLKLAEAKLEQTFDYSHGGFGGAPKFPHPMDVQLLLRLWHRWPRDGVLEMVNLTLDKMAHGGIYDHLGGGFARYSVDERWLVPHFEKMLYDNALLAGAYLDGYLATGKQDYARVACETLDYILAYMTDPAGGFHSTEDADSEGVEGKFYVWTPDEIKQILGEEKGERFCDVYDVSKQGNFEGQNILNLPKTIEQSAALHDWDLDELSRELAESRAELLTVRDRRVRPGKDDKILVSWNALMIDTLARAAGVLDEPKYLQAAVAATRFIFAQMSREDGRLLHCWRHGRAKLDAYLDDYTYLINALVTLYEADFDEHWIDEAVRLAEIVLKHFADEEGGGFFFTADDHQRLIARNKDIQDGSVPSGNAMAATALLRLGKLCGRDDFTKAAEGSLQLAVGLIRRAPSACGQMLIAADMYFGPMPEIVVLGDKSQDETAAVLSQLHQQHIPNRVIACRAEADRGSAHLSPLFAGKTPQDKSPAVFLCENFTCQSPVSGKSAALELWQQLATPGQRSA